MKITVANLTQSNVSTPVGLLGPAESKSDTLSPARAYLAAGALKSMVDAGYITVTVTEETGLLDSVEPAAVGTASVADGAVTAAKLASAAVTAGKIGTGGVSAAGQFAAGVVDAAALAALAVTKAKALVFVSAEQTANGSAQNVAHGLAATPSAVLVIPTLVTGGAFTITEGSHTSTNVIVTMTTGMKYKVFAWA